jgi:phosphate transport system ATP-binding protein
VTVLKRRPHTTGAEAEAGRGTRQAEGTSPGERTAPAVEARSVALEGLHAYYREALVLKGIDLQLMPNRVTAIIGPSGSGKSTLLRCMNRMHEVTPGARVAGRVLVDGTDIYGPDVDVTAVRRLVGMVFQKPNPFPTMSIADNVAAGLKLAGVRGGEVKDRVHDALVAVGLWEEVKSRLRDPGTGLSGGQQQRLCIARTLAVEPEVVLLDEPASALDPASTLKIEQLMDELKERYTIVVVTHNLQQAARVADTTAFMLAGELIEAGPTHDLFTTPRDERTERYVTGKFG